MKVKKIILVFLVQVFVLTGPVYSLTIKIGSSAPDRSPWHKVLRKMGNEWARITNNEIQLEIYPFGVAGNKEEMVRKMREGKLGGAALFDFVDIYPDIYVSYIPFLTSSEKEFDYVFNKMKKYFIKGIEAKGFKVIILAFMGWYYIFSENPVFYPEDLQKHKLSIIGMRPELKQAWNNAGYDVEVTDFKAPETAVQRGKVHAFFLSPIVAALGQFFTLARNMCSARVSPIVGGFVLSKKTWEKIPGKYKKQMLEVVQKQYDDFYENIKKLEKEAIEEMEQYDLIVNKLPADALEKWHNNLDKFTEKLKGNVLSEEVYNRVLKHLKEYREEIGQKQ